MDLNNVKNMAKLDKENMMDLLVSFPRQCEDALFIAEHTDIKSQYKRDYEHIVFTGLGGSAIGADIIRNYVSGDIKTPIFVNRDYTLPAFVNKKTLLFAVSYSGNTEETLSAYTKAKERGAKIIVVTSGGKLKDRALKNGDMFVSIPKGYPPRCALGYSFIPPVVILSKLGFIKNRNTELKKAADLLDSLRKKKLGPSVREDGNTAKNIARKIYNKFPVIYSSNKLDAIATRWRGQFAENSKTLSSAHVFPEMNHNEIVGWMNPRYLLREFVAIVLKDSRDHSRVKRRMLITGSILKKEKFNILEIESQGQTLLDRMLSLIYLGDFTSYYLSLLNRLDPTPVDRITYLKKQLAK